MSFYAEAAAVSARHNYLSVFRKFLKSSACIAVILVATGAAALADGKYFNADGSKTDDLEAAAATWRTPEFLKDHALAGVKAEYAYAHGITGKGVKIAAVDSGVLTSHPQLAGKITSLTVQGTYGADGDRYEGAEAGKWSWKKGDKFSVSGDYDPAINDSHGTAAAGEMVGLRDGQEMHGIAFDAHLYSVNTGGTDATVFGHIVDYDYFKEAYSVASRNGARVVNSSWGQEYSKAGDYGTIAGLTNLYSMFFGKKTFLDAVDEVSTQYKTIQVWANGNEGRNNPRAVASLPYFRPGLEKYWIAVTGVDKNGNSHYDRCGVTKYWCMAGPTVDIYSTSVGRNGNDYDFGHGQPTDKIAPTYLSWYNGTSAAAPNVTASLALVMQRFPYLDNSQARDVMFTTATHLTDARVPNDNPDLPNEVFGWGRPNMESAMNGPAQFMDRFVVNLSKDDIISDEVIGKDTWSNDISDKALIARKAEEVKEIADWEAKKSAYGWTNGREGTSTDMLKNSTRDRFVSEWNIAKPVLTKLIQIFDTRPIDVAVFWATYNEAQANSAGKAYLNAFEKVNPGWIYTSELLSARVSKFEVSPEGDMNKISNFFITEAIAAELGGYDVSVQRNKYLMQKLEDPSSYESGLTKLGTGQLTLTGDSTYSGDTIVDGGELVIGKEGSITSASFVNDTALFTVEGIAAATTVNKGGRLNVAVGGSTGDTSVIGGWAAVNGKSGSTSVGDAGVVSGGGTLDSLIAKSGGVVSPGNSVGTLNVSKDATFEKGSSFEVEIKPDFLSADHLAIAGQATLLGGVVNVRLENDAALLTEDVTKSLFLKTFDILTAVGGVTGQFESVWPRYNYITANLDYKTDASKVILGFNFTPEAEAEAAKKAEDIRIAEAEAKRVAEEADDKAAEAGAETKLLVTEVAETTKEAELEAAIKTFLSPEFLAIGVKSRNQKSVWKGIQSTGWGNPLLAQVAASSSDNPLDFDVLSGEVHASLSGVLAADSHFIADAAQARVRNAFGGVAGKEQAVTTPLAYGPESKAKHSDAFAPVEPAPATTAFWGEAYGSWAHADGDGNASGYSRNTGGLVTGFDGIVADDWRFGLLAGYGSTSLQTGYGKASVDSYQIGVYGGTKLDALGLRLGVNLGQHEIDTKRTARFGTLNNEHEASYDAQTVQVFGELGYEIATPYAKLEPFAAARHVHVKTGSFKEDGAVSSLSGEGSSTDLTITTLGLRAAHQFTLSESTTLTARGMLGWTHGFGDVTPEASLALNSSAGFTVEGAGIAKDAAIIEAGFDIGIGRATTIGLSYTGQFSSQSHDNAIKADLSVRF
ncbi:autotransporter domain-containing protein [Phyllobacterium sp. SB3]|uniref:autotransporter domain-containing protein n=1 Tax=Phyllobacterium sp. SB3 TaxID=3156073 RepID=UPI0032B0071D